MEHDTKFTIKPNLNNTDMKSKKHVIALIVAIIAIALFFFAHYNGWGTIFETILLCISFLATSYLLFFNSFVKTLGEETAKMMMLEEKITIEEQIKTSFSKLIEEFKSDLEKKNIAFGADYTLYITERTKVCDELYKRLVDLYTTACDHTNIKTHETYIFIGNDGPADAFPSFTSKIMEYYNKNKIYLTKDISSSIVGFITILGEHCLRNYSLNTEI